VPVAGTVAPSAGKPATPSPRLVKAQEEASKKESEAAEAAQEARSVSERIEALHKNIQLERSQLSNARKRADNSQETERTLDEDLQRRWTEGAERTELDGLRQKIADARQRFHEAGAEIKDRTDRLDSLQSELSTLQAEELAAMRDAEVKRVEAEKARKKVERLQNPFAPHNVLQWTLDHGPRILVIVLSMGAIVWIARLLERRITDWMAHHGKRGTVEDENRAKTLVGVFHNAIRVVVLLGGSLMILAEVGVNIIPLMGGAAVLGLAAAFGGQNLLRDYFTGFMILLENQYGINDVVKIGDVAGMVERITLRLTVLRDLDGRVHFIPNGHIATVSNLTHGWSRALIEIGISYKEDVDRVMELLDEMGKELRRDPEFRHMILEQPEMLGLDQFGDSAVVIKFFIKTRPLMQWTVKREMLRRIKKRFDELGIEIPFPHRTVYHHYDSDDRPHQADDRSADERRSLHSSQDAGS
jgi:small conductance mechanosensitive channel